jgi:ribosomal subunit interface protein
MGPACRADAQAALCSRLVCRVLFRAHGVATVRLESRATSVNERALRGRLQLVMLALLFGAECSCFATLPDSSPNPTGATMNVSISYKHVDAQQPVTVEVMRRLDKLSRLLKSYQPDMIQLKGVFSKNQRTEEQSCALTLSLPNGTLHATGNGKNVLAGCKKAFSEIETQVKKHQSRLRREHEWKRKRPIE